MEGHERFAMRRERDIVDAVNKHARLVFRVAQINPPEHLFLKVRIYWTKNKATEVDHLDLPEYVLQQLLQNKSIDNILFAYGQQWAGIKERPKGVQENAKPIGITISAETIFAFNLSPHGDTHQKAKGPPVLIVAGRTATGKHHVKLFPIALIDEEGPMKDFRVLGLTAPAVLEDKIEEIKKTAEDFMKPFFDGYKEGGTVHGKLMNAS